MSSRPRDVSIAAAPYRRLLAFFLITVFAQAAVLFQSTQLQAQVGPGAVAGPVNVPAGAQTVVGSTTITSAGTNAGVNVTGTGTLTFDPTAGPSPGAIAVQ